MQSLPTGLCKVPCLGPFRRAVIGCKEWPAQELHTVSSGNPKETSQLPRFPLLYLLIISMNPRVDVVCLFLGPLRGEICSMFHPGFANRNRISLQDGGRKARDFPLSSSLNSTPTPYPQRKHSGNVSSDNPQKGTSPKKRTYPVRFEFGKHLTRSAIFDFYFLGSWLVPH